MTPTSRPARSKLDSCPTTCSDWSWLAAHGDALPTDNGGKAASELLSRLEGARAKAVQEASERNRAAGRMTTIVRYVRVLARHADAQFEALECTAGSRQWLVRDEWCKDTPAPARPLADRPGWQLAMRVLREGYADGVMAPRYEQVSSDLAAYEEVLNELHEGGWFLGLAIPERGS